MNSDVAKIMFVMEGVAERKESRFLETVLTPKLDFPCIVQVVANHMEAYNLTKQQDFHGIILPPNNAEELFHSDAFTELVRTVKGFTASLVHTVDPEHDATTAPAPGGCRTILRRNESGGFAIDDLVHTITSIASAHSKADSADTTDSAASMFDNTDLDADLNLGELDDFDVEAMRRFEQDSKPF